MISDLELYKDQILLANKDDIDAMDAAIERSRTEMISDAEKNLSQLKDFTSAMDDSKADDTFAELEAKK